MKRAHYIVVGGTRGMGLVCARRLAEEGNAVSVLGTSAPRTVPGVFFHKTRLENPAVLKRSLDRAIAAHGPLSGLLFFQRYRGKGDSWAGEMKVTLGATRLAIDHAVSRFSPSGPRAIVVIGSLAARLVADDASLGYHAAKAALLQMARYYAAKLGPRRIRVNCVTPGMIAKPEALEYYRKNKTLTRLYERVIPLGRLGLAEDVAEAARFLCSASASYITGQELIVDGGLSLDWPPALAEKLGKR